MRAARGEAVEAYGASEALESEISEEPEPEKKGSGKVAVAAAIAGNVLVAVLKFIAAGISGSVAMLSEGIHSLVDCGNGILVLVGMRRSKKEPDFLHPFGYGKELYFWTLIVALLIFLLGGGVSLHEGIESLREAHEGTKVMGNMTMNFVVIIGAMIIEGASFMVAVREFNKARGDVGPFKFIHDAKDPSLYTVVLEDMAAELGLVAALVGTVVCYFTGNLYADGVASVFIGLLLCCVAVLLLVETKGLLVGEGMKSKSIDEMRDLIESDPRIVRCGRILTMYMGPESLLVTLDATFDESLREREILVAIDDLEAKIVERWPQTTRVFIEVESLRACLAGRREEDNWEDEDAADEAAAAGNEAASEPIGAAYVDGRLWVDDEK